MFTGKVTIPQWPRKVISRRRLLAALEEIPAGGLGIIRAPAGYGKTTLLVDSLKSQSSRRYWLTIDEWDKDHSRFLKYLCLAVGLEHGVLGAGQPDDPLEPISLVTGALAEGNGATLVLDDAHHLPAGLEALGALDYLVRQLPENARLILSSRSKLALPSLPRLRMQGRAIEVTAEELAFTEEEIITFYEQSRARILSPEEAASIRSITAGWPAAVALGAAPTGSGNGQQMGEYVIEEVVRRLPDDLAEFLRETSVLPTLTPDLCAAVTGRDDSWELLERLEVTNLPVWRLGRDELGIHALVRDQLLSLLKQDRRRYKECRSRAGLAMQQAGRVDEAVEHFAEASDWAAARGAIADQAPAAYRDGRWHAITMWLQALPPEYRESHVDLSLWEARVLVRFGRADDALRVIERCQRSAPAIAEATMSELESLRSAALRVKGDSEAAVVSGRRAVELALTSDAALTVLAESRRQLGMALFVSGSYQAAVEEMQAALEIFDRRGEAEEAATLNSCIGSALASLGRISDAIVHLQYACEQWRRVGNSKELSWTLNNLAMAHLLGGQRDTAREQLVEAVDLAREAEYARAEAYATASLADLDRLRSDLQSARIEYRQALHLASEVGEPSLRAVALAGLACLEASSGDPIRAEALAQEALSDAKERRVGHEEALARTGLAMVSRQRGEMAPASDELAAADTLLTSLGPSREHMEILLLLADSLLPLRHRRAQLTTTLGRLAATAESAGAENYVALLAREHLPVVQFGASRRIAGGFYRGLLKKIQGEEGGRDHSGSDGLPMVDVRALGGFRATIDGRPVLDIEWESEKAKELLLLLLISRDSVSRDEAVAYLWPDLGGKQASSVFHSSLYRLRRALYPSAVIHEGGRYALNPRGTFRFDVQRFRELVERPRPRDGEEAEDLREAIELYRGPLTGELESEWIDELRGDLDRVYVRASERLINRLLANQGYAEAICLSQALLDRDPLDEGACRMLLQAALKSGETRTGLQAYDRLTNVLVAELGERPADDLTRLADDLRMRLTDPP